jgi:hypothetical protein
LSLMARNGPPEMAAIRSLTGGKRTCGGQPFSVAIDPVQTSGGRFGFSATIDGDDRQKSI